MKSYYDAFLDTTKPAPLVESEEEALSGPVKFTDMKEGKRKKEGKKKKDKKVQRKQEQNTKAKKRNEKRSEKEREIWKRTKTTKKLNNSKISNVFSFLFFVAKPSMIVHEPILNYGLTDEKIEPETKENNDDIDGEGIFLIIFLLWFLPRKKCKRRKKKKKGEKKLK